MGDLFVEISIAMASQVVDKGKKEINSVEVVQGSSNNLYSVEDKANDNDFNSLEVRATIVVG